jgi:hypothetical protein
MGCLDGQNYMVMAIEWTGTSHDREGGRLQVPQKIARELGSGDDQPIHLTIRERAGTVLFEGVLKLGSGTEAYPIPGLGRREAIIVVARRL